MRDFLMFAAIVAAAGLIGHLEARLRRAGFRIVGTCSAAPEIAKVPNHERQ